MPQLQKIHSISAWVSRKTGLRANFSSKLKKQSIQFRTFKKIHVKRYCNGPIARRTEVSTIAPLEIKKLNKQLFWAHLLIQYVHRLFHEPNQKYDRIPIGLVRSDIILSTSVTPPTYVGSWFQKNFRLRASQTTRGPIELLVR